MFLCMDVRTNFSLGTTKNESESESENILFAMLTISPGIPGSPRSPGSPAGPCKKEFAKLLLGNEKKQQHNFKPYS